MFSGSSYSMDVVAMFPDQTERNRKWKIQDAAFKFEIRLCQHVHDIAMKFQRFYLCIRGPVIQWKFRKLSLVVKITGTLHVEYTQIRQSPSPVFDVHTNPMMTDRTLNGSTRLKNFVMGLNWFSRQLFST